MKYLITVFVVLFFTNTTIACEFFAANSAGNIDKLMGKKSNLYDAYRQGKCVLEEALRPLSEEQREVIARLIAKTYNLEN